MDPSLGLPLSPHAPTAHPPVSTFYFWCIGSLSETLIFLSKTLSIVPQPLYFSDGFWKEKCWGNPKSLNWNYQSNFFLEKMKIKLSFDILVGIFPEIKISNCAPTNHYLNSEIEHVKDNLTKSFDASTWYRGRQKSETIVSFSITRIRISKESRTAFSSSCP